MINTIYITNPSDDTLTLSMRDSGENEGLIIFNMEGLGPPKATISGVGSPNVDGIRVSFVKTDARHILMTLVIPVSASEETAKQKIYDYFPIKGEITFRVQSDTKNVNIPAIVESVEMNQFAKVENAVISLYCPDPYFLSVGEQTPFISSGGTLITYNGELSTGVDIIVSFTGDATGDLYITNTAGNQELVIGWASITYWVPGVPLRDGDQLVINTRFGERSAIFTRDSTDYNLLNVIALDADWIQLLLGANTIAWSMAVGEANVSVQVKYRSLFEGV